MRRFEGQFGRGCSRAVPDSDRLHFRDSLIRVAPIVAALHNEIKRALTQDAGGVLFLIEMTWTIRIPSDAVYLLHYPYKRFKVEAPEPT
jgi:hypothetical protein